MANDDGNKPPSVSRRDTLKLATAVSALGVGLGAFLESGEVHAETIKIDQQALGGVALKLYKLADNGKDVVLLQALDLSPLFATANIKAPTTYYLKFFNLKMGNEGTLLMSHELRVAAPKPK